MMYRNHYRCPCGCEWQDEWDCMCNDRCPDCDAECEPVCSEEFGEVHTELTPAGEQLVIPGCERNLAPAARQLDLF